MNGLKPATALRPLSAKVVRQSKESLSFAVTQGR